MKKIKEIEILKGLGIFLVVLGHTSLPKPISQWIFSFHMPLFFFLSGITFKKKDLVSFAKIKFKRIMLPYFFFGLLSYIISIIKSNTSFLPIKDFFIGTLLGISNDYFLSYNVVLWFLPCVFITLILFNLVSNLIKSEKLALTFFVTLWIFGVLYTLNFDEILPFHFDSALLMIPFFLLGVYNNSLKSQIAFFLKSGIFKYSFFIILTYLALFNLGNVDIRTHQIENPILFYFISFNYIILLHEFSGFLKLNKIIIWLSFNSLGIMCMHLKVRFISVFLLNNFDLYNGLLVVIVSLIILVIPIYLVNKYFPILVGLKK